MTTERTIKICGKDVLIRYCAATETFYEKLAEKSSSVFVPTIEKDEKGKITNIVINATTDDFIKLGFAAITAAYARKNEEPPVSVKDILFDASSDEMEALIKTVSDLRKEWYVIPSVVDVKNNMTEDEKEATEKEEKN